MPLAHCNFGKTERKNKIHISIFLPLNSRADSMKNDDGDDELLRVDAYHDAAHARNDAARRENEPTDG